MPELASFTLLVIEDDADARELMLAVLEQRGAKVHTAESVSRAFEIIELMELDAIISDIAMPEEDGLTFVRRLRQREPRNGGTTPAIAVSAFVASGDRARALEAGFARYLHKPVDFDELVRTIRDVVVAARR